MSTVTPASTAVMDEHSAHLKALRRERPSFHDLVRMVVFSLDNWSVGEQVYHLQRRRIYPDSALTQDEARNAFPHRATYVAQAKAHFNPMVTNGEFVDAQQRYKTRIGGAAIDLIISYVLEHPANLNDHPSIPPLHRTKTPQLDYVAPSHFAQMQWEA